MPTQIKFVIQAYLNAIAGKAQLDAEDSDHGTFWKVSYNDFKNGVVPGIKCQGNPIPLIDKQDPGNSAFYLVLTGDKKYCSKPQMPKTGPYVTDPNYTATLADGTVVTGTKILVDIHEWLTNGFPE